MNFFESVKYLLALLGENRKFIPQILLFGLMVSLLNLAIPISVQAVVNTLGFLARQQPLIILSFLLLMLLFISAFFYAIQIYLLELFQQKIFTYLGEKISIHLMRSDRRHIEEKNGQELMNRFFDVFSLQKGLATLITDGFAIVLQLFVGLVLISFYHPYFLVFNLLLLMALFLVVFIPLKNAILTAFDESTAKYTFVAWLEEHARALPLLQTRDYIGNTLRRSEALIADYIKKRRKHFYYRFSQSVGLVTLYAIASAVLLGMGGWLVLNDELSLGQLVASEIIVTGILLSLAKSGKYLEIYYDTIASVRKIRVMFDVPTETQTYRVNEKTPEVDISFQEVSVPCNENIFALNLNIPAKSRWLLDPEFTSCREIFIDLLLKNTVSDLGDIFINGTSISKHSMFHLNSLVYVLKAPRFFQGTIRQNLVGDNDDITDAEIMDVLHIVDLKQIVSLTGDGVHAEIGMSGKPFWQSQWIRFELARGILLKRPIFILTDYFEFISLSRQEKILDYLLLPERNWTFIYFSHRKIKKRHFDYVGKLSWTGVTCDEKKI